jgi:predicted negative regulator of RcsB-dependent stress response
MKAFIKENGELIILMTTIIGCGFWVTNNMKTLQAEHSKQFYVMLEKSDAKFQQESEKFDAKFQLRLEKINEISK